MRHTFVARLTSFVLIILLILLSLVLTTKIAKGIGFTCPRPTFRKFVSGIKLNSEGGFDDQSQKSTFRVNSSCDITLAITLCEEVDNSRTPSSRKRSMWDPSISDDFSRQINQTLVLLKSILITSKFSGTSSCVRVVIVAEERKHFEEIETRVFLDAEWDFGFTQFLKLSFVQAHYPPGTKWMRNIWRPCATLRLFLPELLTSFETLIYVDTDFIFFRSVQELWTEFNSFSNVTLGGMVPSLSYYTSKTNKVPYYGPSGLNSGIMLMNLTRMRETQWTRKIPNLAQMFRSKIRLADQDILNIYFHDHPDELHLLPCNWNFRFVNCRPESHCGERRLLTEGISALHGCASSFTSFGSEPLFHSVFRLFETTPLHSNFCLRTFIERLDFLLFQTQETSRRSQCVKYGAFNAILLNNLQRLSQLQPH